MKSTFSILFYIKRNEPRKDGTVIIMCRITIDGIRSQFSSKLLVHPDLWDNKNGRAKAVSIQTRNLNRTLDSIQGTLTMHYNRLMNVEGYVRPETIRNIFLGHEEKGKTLISFFEKHNEQYKLKVGTTTTWTTYTKYELTKSRILEFLKKQYNVSDIPIKEVTTVFLQDFYLFLRNTHGSGNNNAMKNMQRLRAVFNYAKNSGTIFIDPFGNFKMSFEKADRCYLEKEEIDIIYNKHFSSERLEKVRDVFIFSCYSGLSYSDLRDLKQENITRSFDGNLWITSKRNKTGIRFNVRLFDIPIEIIQKYEEKQKDGRLLPMISNQNMNEYLHEIAEICKINKKITCHVARHTFATLCMTAGLPIESVSKMLGHSNIRTTQTYARIIDQKLSNDMNLLAEKLNQNEKKNLSQVV